MAIQTGVEHTIQCACCGSENVEGEHNSQGLWYGTCKICGCRFWDRLHYE